MVNRTQVVLLSGKQGSGKTTTSTLLAEHCFKNKWEHSTIKFAKPLYAMHDAVRTVALDYGIPMPEKDGKLLQLLGTEWGRAVYGDSLWTDIARKTVTHLTNVWNNAELKSPTALAIIDDCRFENEFDAFPEALKVRLVAPEEIRKPRTHAWRDNTLHPSEIGLDAYEAAKKFDLVIDTGTLPQSKVLAMIMYAVGLRAGAAIKQEFEGYFGVVNEQAP